MENYNYAPSYPESGDSSPRSREVDFENPPPWEDQNQPQNYRVKFMCSYGGKIHPRPHDNQLAYVGGETKILAVDRGIKFTSLNSKLSALCGPLDDGITFKYQLPGEDLDALISVTNDDDLEHMMHEYDRLYKASPKPARLRLFLFPMNPPPLSGSQRSFGSEEGRSEKEQFVEALNSGPVLQSPAAVAAQNNVDFLFGLEKGSPSATHVQVQQTQVKIRDQMTEMSSGINEPEQVPVQSGEDRGMALDPIQKHIQDLQRLRLEEQQGLYRRNSDDNLGSGYPAGEYYVQKFPEKVAQVQGTSQIPAGYWPEKQIQGGGGGGGGVYQGTTITGEQQFYMMPPPGGPYHPQPHPHPHSQMVRPMNPPVNQGYYAVQRMQPEMYNVVSNTSMPPPVAAAPPPTQPQVQGQQRYSDGINMGRPGASAGIGMGMVDAGQYSQMMYDNGVGRQVYYNAPGGQVMSGPPQPLPGGSAPQYQAVPADMRQGGALNHDGSKGVAKATQASV